MNAAATTSGSTGTARTTSACGAPAARSATSRHASSHHQTDHESRQRVDPRRRRLVLVGERPDHLQHPQGHVEDQLQVRGLAAALRWRTRRGPVVVADHHPRGPPARRDEHQGRAHGQSPPAPDDQVPDRAPAVQHQHAEHDADDPERSEEPHEGERDGRGDPETEDDAFGPRRSDPARGASRQAHSRNPGTSPGRWVRPPRCCRRPRGTAPPPPRAWPIARTPPGTSPRPPRPADRTHDRAGDPHRVERGRRAWNGSPRSRRPSSTSGRSRRPRWRCAPAAPARRPVAVVADRCRRARGTGPEARPGPVVGHPTRAARDRARCPSQVPLPPATPAARNAWSTRRHPGTAAARGSRRPGRAAPRPAPGAPAVRPGARRPRRCRFPGSAEVGSSRSRPALSDRRPGSRSARERTTYLRSSAASLRNRITETSMNVTTRT